MRRTRSTNPDAINWTDRGCSVRPKCVDCPLPVCRYEVHGGYAAIQRPDRDAEIIQRRRAGAKILELQDRFGLQRRQIFRILASS
jgi:hypothetical protein